jgi:LPS-assembly lipoprotein
MWWFRSLKLRRAVPLAAFRCGVHRAFLLAAALLLPLPVLSACGWHPLYGSAAYGGAREALADVHIAPIADRTGQNLYNELRDRMNPEGQPADPQYDLVIGLKEDSQQLLIQPDQTATRVNLTIYANYALYQRGGDPAHPLLTGQTRVATTYDLLTNQFASVTSEADARRRGAVSLANDIADRVAAYLAQPASGQAPGG